MGEAIDMASGGKGGYGQLLDLIMAGKPTTAADYALLGWAIQQTNAWKSTFFIAPYGRYNK